MTYQRRAFAAAAALTAGLLTAATPPASAHDTCDAVAFARTNAPDDRMEGHATVTCPFETHTFISITVCLEYHLFSGDPYRFEGCSQNTFSGRPGRHEWSAMHSTTICKHVNGQLSLAYWRAYATYTIGDHGQKTVIGGDQLMFGMCDPS